MRITKDFDAINVYYDVAGPKWEARVLLRSDAHRDSIDANTTLEKRHLEMAKERGALIADFGDASDVMQSRNDPRRTKKGLRAIFAQDNYLNLITEDSFNFYRRYSTNWILMAQGNHEWAVLEHNGYDLVEALVKELNEKTGSHVYTGGYEGWIRFFFTINGTQKQSLTLWYTHGSGGGAPVTKGVINTNRRAVFLPDADIVVSGHTHHGWNMPVARIQLSQAGKEFQSEQLHIQIPGYHKRGDWEKRKGMPPKPMGAYWLRFTVEDKRIRPVAIRV